MVERMPEAHWVSSILDVAVVADGRNDGTVLVAWHERSVSEDGQPRDTVLAAATDKSVPALTQESLIFEGEGSRPRWRGISEHGVPPQLTFLRHGVLVTVGGRRGDQAQPITDYWTVPISQFCWSADGATLAVTVPTRPSRERFVTTMSGVPVAQLAQTAEHRPDGLVVDGSHELWSMRDGIRLHNNDRLLADTDADSALRGIAWHVGEIAVLPDGERILFTAKPLMDRDTVAGSRLYLSRDLVSDGSNRSRVRLLEDPARISGLTTSLDGQFAVYAAPRADRRDRGQAFSRVHVLDIGTYKEFCLTPELDIDVGYGPLNDAGHFHPRLVVATAADGEPVVVFHGTRRISGGLVSAGLYSVGIESRRVTPLYEPSQDADSDAVFTFAVTGNTIAIVTNGPHNPGTVKVLHSHPALSPISYATGVFRLPPYRNFRYINNEFLDVPSREAPVRRRPEGNEHLVAGSTAIADWTTFTQPNGQLDDAAFRVSYHEIDTGNPAGPISVEIYEPPADVDTGAAIAMVHGGPATAWGAGHSVLAASLAAAGFTLFRVNSGGSAVTEESVAQAQYLTQWGTRDVDDSLAALTTLCAERGVRRFGAIGASKGGCELAQLMARRPELFDCVILDRPVLDLVNNAYDRDDYMSVVSEPGLSAAQEQRVLQENSPLHRVALMRAGLLPPMLVITGAVDARVPSAVPFVNMLKRRHDPVEAAGFLGASHWIGLGATSTEVAVTRNEMITAFFRHHLVDRFVPPAKPYNDIVWALTNDRNRSTPSPRR